MQILIKLSTGVLAFCRPVGAALKDETEQAYLERIGQTTIEKCTRDGQPGWAGAVVVAYVADDVINTADWSFRPAWDWTTPAPVMDYDMAKCRAIHRDRMRVARAPKLAALDVEFMRAIEENRPDVELEEIAARKQVLRDVPADPAIDAAQSTEELKAVWPTSLN